MEMEHNPEALALRAAFRALEPTQVLVHRARKLGGGVLSNDAQAFFLEECLNDEVTMAFHLAIFTILVAAKTCKLYPPGWLYLRRTLKEVILAAENDGEEVLDGLYELHAVYLQPPQDGSSELAPKCYKSYTYTVPAKSRAYLACKTGCKKKVLEDDDAEHLVTLRVSLNMLEGDTGCSTWPAGLLLSEFVLSHPELFHGQKCLEVGAGAGMVGVLLARMGASKVLLTDGSLATLANMRLNLSINNVEVEGLEQVNGALSTTTVKCQQLPWETLPDKELLALESNVILGADLIYDPLYIPHLVKLVASLLSRDHPARTNSLEENVHEFPVAYIASAVRNPDSLVYFVDTVRKAGLRMVEVSESMRPDTCLSEISGLNRATILIHRLQAWRD